MINDYDHHYLIVGTKLEKGKRASQVVFQRGFLMNSNLEREYPDAPHEPIKTHAILINITFVGQIHFIAYIIKEKTIETFHF